MKLEKAIEILEIESRCLSFKGATDRLVALKLGIEAMKRCGYNYLNPQRADFRRLPGEEAS